MEDFCKGILLGMIAGVCVGGILVAKNRKLACKINQGVDMASEKIEEAKEMVKEKIDEANDQNNKEEQSAQNPIGDGSKHFSIKNSKK